MKSYKNRFISLIALLMTMVLGLTSCEKEGIKPAQAVLVSVSYMNFEADNPGDQMITVYADGRWTVEFPEWLTVSPAEGDGTMDVTISATPNMDGGEVDQPRSAELIFKGEKLRSQYTLHVKQVGDKFRGIEPIKIDKLTQLEDKALVHVSNALVVGKSQKGVILNDGSSNVYAAMEKGEVGDLYEIWGSKTTKNGVAVIESIERSKLISSGNPVAAKEPEDITESLDQYSNKASAFVSIQGVYNGTKVSVSGSKLSLVLVDPLPEFDLKELFAHKIAIEGYFIGKDASSIKLVVTAIKDLGEVARVVWFKDDFSWLKKYEEAWNKANPSKKAGDSVGKEKSDQAPNIANPNDKTFGPMDFWGDFTERGYDDFVGQSTTGGPHNSIYLQTYYLKFSRTDVHNGLKLTKPLPADYKGQDVNLQFDWCAHCDNNKPADDIQLVIEIVGDGTILSNGKKVSDPIYHKQSKDKMEYFWQPVSITLTGLSTSSKIYIRPLKYLTEKGDMPNRQRWYIDNILLDSYDMD